MTATVLDQLQDIHPPATVSWWPPAPGWWILALLVLVLLATIYLLMRRRRRLRYRRTARKLLTTCWQRYLDSGDDAHFIRDALALVRRTLRHSQHATGAGAQATNSGAAMSTPDLLAYLNARAGGALTRAIPLAALALRFYQPTAMPLTKSQARSLYRVVKHWLRRPGAPPC